MFLPCFGNRNSHLLHHENQSQSPVHAVLQDIPLLKHGFPLGLNWSNIVLQAKRVISTIRCSWLWSPAATLHEFQKSCNRGVRWCSSLLWLKMNSGKKKTTTLNVWFSVREANWWDSPCSHQRAKSDMRSGIGIEGKDGWLLSGTSCIRSWNDSACTWASV